MLDRHDSRRIPLNSNSRFLLTIGGQKRRFYRNVKPLAAPFHMKDKLVVRVFADVFKQRDRIIDGRLIKSANDISRTQPRRSSRRVGFHSVDNRGLCWIDEQLAYAFSAPSTGFCLVRFHPNG